MSFLKEFKTVNVLLSGCSSGNITFWDIVRRDVICNFTALGDISCGDLTMND